VLQHALQGESARLETLDERGHLDAATLDLSGFSANDAESDVLERAGLRLYRPPLDAVLGRVVPGSPAEHAGLRPGDRIVAADGTPIRGWDAFVNAVRAKPGRPIALRVERDGRSEQIEVTPDARTRLIGAGPWQPPDYAAKILIRVKYGPLESVQRGAAKTWDIAAFSLKMLGRMLVGELSWRHLSGPVTIADFAGQSAQMGWISYVTFLALISISLGVLNLLPIPLLDGGHLMYYGIEIVKGSPVSERFMELGQRVGLALLLVMMAFAFYNDLNRLLTG
jgi:regulator of sigma E protease